MERGIGNPNASIAFSVARRAQEEGAEVVLTRSDVGKGHPDYYQDVAGRLAREIPGAWYADQFGNPANPRAHETTTGPEILEQMERLATEVLPRVGAARP